MGPYACRVLLPRILLIAGLTAALLAFTAGSAAAGEPEPEAIVVNSNGRVVSVIETRSEATDAFARAVDESPSQRLSLEYVYRATGTLPNPPNDPILSQQWSFHRIGVPTSWTSADGEGVVVSILDSAVNFTGQDGFCTKVVSPYDAIEMTEGLADLNTSAEFGHGTHIAGTIAQYTNNEIGRASCREGV